MSGSRPNSQLQDPRRPNKRDRGNRRWLTKRNASTRGNEQARQDKDTVGEKGHEPEGYRKTREQSGARTSIPRVAEVR